MNTVYTERSEYIMIKMAIAYSAETIQTKSCTDPPTSIGSH